LYEVPARRKRTPVSTGGSILPAAASGLKVVAALLDQAVDHAFFRFPKYQMCRTVAV